MPKTVYKCMICGTLFERWPSQINNQNVIACSLSCAGKIRGKMQRGRRNLMYRHGHYALEKCICENETNPLCSVCYPNGYSAGVSDDDVASAVSISSSFIEVARRLNMGRSAITRRIKDLKLDIAHFKWSQERSDLMEDVFTKGDRRRGSRKLLRLLCEFGYVEKVTCSECGLAPKWHSDPLRLHLHHINGIGTDNRVENLAILCPNCHSQTNTFTGRNIRNAKNDV